MYVVQFANNVFVVRIVVVTAFSLIKLSILKAYVYKKIKFPES